MKMMNMNHSQVMVYKNLRFNRRRRRIEKLYTNNFMRKSDGPKFPHHATKTPRF